MRVLTAAVASTLGLCLVLGHPALATAQFNKLQQKCLATIAKDGGKFVKGVLKERLKCATKNLDTTGSCDLATRDAKIAKFESKLRAALQKKCVDKFPPTFDDENLSTIGFPGKCPDGDPADGFTGADLQDCIVDSHTTIVNGLFEIQYGFNSDDGVVDFATRAGNPGLGKQLATCQKEIGKRGVLYALRVHKEIRRCRDGLIKGKFSGFLPVNCADNPIFPKPAERIAKAATSARDKIFRNCKDSLLADPNMDVCDVGGGPAPTEASAADCIIATHTNAVDDPNNSGTATPFAIDLIDIEYALGAICGDNIANEPAVPGVFQSLFYLGEPPEECDGVDDGACPGQCGAPGSDFPCLCTARLRIRVVEHGNADLDNGWSGTSHDSSVVEGGGYVVDLYDCDGPAGPDTTCTIGPSCALPPHNPCTSDATCAGAGNFCRTSGIATGPRCDQDFQTSCVDKSDCPNSSDFCRKTPHGAPLPLSSGGVAVCVANAFSENVVGTLDFATGEAAYRLRQDAVTHLASGTLNQPCPTCGGFCSGIAGPSGPGTRTLCAADSDCPASGTCVTDAVCSFGPNEDRACRRGGQFGNPTALFGTPSVDCPPAPISNISGKGLDILFNPSTTGTLVTLPGHPCNAPTFAGRKCIFGTEIGKACSVDGDCAGGGPGSCVFQCFCPSIGGTAQKPNDCFAACRGGSNDYGACGADSDCPGGLCEQASCRVAAGVCTGGASVGTPCGADSDCGASGICGDDDSSGEGFCPSGPVIGLCSFTAAKGCSLDADCRPSGSCAFCLPDESEVCIFRHKNCFPSEGYTRVGVPGHPDRVDVAHFCIPASGNAAVDSTAGIPGPGALEVPLTVVVTP